MIITMTLSFILWLYQTKNNILALVLRTWLYNLKERNTNLIWNSSKITINISINNNNFSTPNSIKYFICIYMYVCVIKDDGDDDEDEDWEEERKESNTYECWNRWRHLLQRKSLSGKPTSPHMQQTVWWSTILMVCCTDRESQSCDDRKGNFEGESERWLRIKKKKCDQWGKREETNTTPKKERERKWEREFILYIEKKKLGIWVGVNFIFLLIFIITRRINPYKVKS